MIYRLKCLECDSFKMLVFKKIIPADGGTSISWDYECVDCGEIRRIDWVEFGGG